MNVKAKQKFLWKIKRMGINGEGIGFYKKTLVFVPGALKEKISSVKLQSVKKKFCGSQTPICE